MVVHSIDVTNIYDKFKYHIQQLATLEDIDIDEEKVMEIYTMLAGMCLKEPTEMESGDLIESMAVLVSRYFDEDEDEYGVFYDIIHGLFSNIRDIYITMSSKGSMFYGTPYDSIDLTVKELNDVVLLEYHSNTMLYNGSIFSHADSDKAHKVMCMVEEFTLFKRCFQSFLSSRNSSIEMEIPEGSYFLLFVGLVELMLMQRDDNIFTTLIENDNVDLNGLLSTTLGIEDPHDMHIFGDFYTKDTKYIGALQKTLSKRLQGNYSLCSWGTLGNKVMIGLSGAA